MTINENTTAVYDPSVKCQERIYYGMAMALSYQFGAQQWTLETRTCRTGLARFAPSEFPRVPHTKPTDFHHAVQIAETFLAIHANDIYRADQERMGQTARDYLR